MTRQQKRATAFAKEWAHWRRKDGTALHRDGIFVSRRERREHARNIAKGVSA